jgi:hypothetical protein
LSPLCTMLSLMPCVLPTQSRQRGHDGQKRYTRACLGRAPRGPRTRIRGVAQHVRPVIISLVVICWRARGRLTRSR